MKKLIAILISVTMLLSLVACGNSGNDGDGKDNASTTVEVGSSVEMLENIWAKFGEDEKFPVVGGNTETPVDGAPGSYDMSYAENLSSILLIPSDTLTAVDEAATMIHMMNANSFTGGTVHLKAGTDIEAFAKAVRDSVQNNQWICGFPETMIIASLGDYVLISYGAGDIMTSFQTHLGEAYSSAKILYNEPVEG